MNIRKVISGGQAGVDQAGLQAAIDCGLEHGGWCPPGRVCETGTIPKHFKLKETPEERDSSAPEIPSSQRTIWNVRDSDASLIFVAKDQRDKGTELGLVTAKQLRKPYLIANPDAADIEQIRHWIKDNSIEVLSAGGPSENTYPGIYEKVYRVLKQVFDRI